MYHFQDMVSYWLKNANFFYPIWALNGCDVIKILDVKKGQVSKLSKVPIQIGTLLSLLTLLYFIMTTSPLRQSSMTYVNEGSQCMVVSLSAA